MRLSFPREFQWGGATAAHQVEGGLDGLNDYGTYAAIPGSPFVERAGTACDHYRRFDDDIAMLAGFGLDTYRFSIEWARIEPEEGHFDSAQMAHYREVLASCRRHGVTPVVTLHHFTSPRWLISQGGWESSATPELFARYSRHVIEELGDLILGNGDQPRGKVCTLNEANTGRINHQLFGPPDDRRMQPWVREAAEKLGVDIEHFTPWTFASSSEAVATVLRSHDLAVETVKSVQPDLEVGLTMASQHVIATKPAYEGAAKSVRWFLEDEYLQHIGRPGRGDGFVGVQSYTHTRVGRRTDGTIGVLPPPKGSRILMMGYDFAPDSLETCIRHTYEMTRLPLLVTECGIGTTFDPERIEYLEYALAGVSRCIDDGIPVEGFIAWSLLDNYEWEYGFRPPFGIVAVDRATQQRVPKESASWLGNVARHNTVVVHDELAAATTATAPQTRRASSQAH